MKPTICYLILIFISCELISQNIYSTNGTLTDNRNVHLNGKDLSFIGAGNLGIGTSVPNTKFHLSTGGNTYGKMESNFQNGIAGFVIDNTGNNSQGRISFSKDDVTRGGVFFSHSSSGNTEKITLDAGGGVPEFELIGAGTVRFPKYGSGLRIGDGYVSGLTSQGALFETGIYESSGNIGIGTTTPTRLLSINGRVVAKEYEATLDGWADYVFHADYRLITLKELEDFITNNGHLPAIPSEAQVVRDGIEIGKMNALLLAKIEEVFLHLIAIEKRIRNLEDIGSE